MKHFDSRGKMNYLLVRYKVSLIPHHSYVAGKLNAE